MEIQNLLHFEQSCLTLISRQYNRKTHPLSTDTDAEQPEESLTPQEKRRLRRLLRRRTRRLKIEVYPTYGTPEHFEVKGKVYADRKVDEVGVEDSRFRNAINTSRRFIVTEASLVWVKVIFGHEVRKVQTDKMGVFSVSFDHLPGIEQGLHTVRVQLAEQTRKRLSASEGTACVLLHSAQSRCVGVISDIDDTVLQTFATSKMRMLRTVFFSNYLTLHAVAEMSDIYRAIHFGPQGDGYEATHYVSSSPDNLMSRLQQFLRHHNFPQGSMDLKSIALRRRPGRDSLFRHTDYKLNRIRKIFETYPQRRYVLFGDSGEHDPQIYRQIQTLYPHQVAAIYIHNVNGEDPYSSRFQGQLLFNDFERVRRDLQQRGIIEKTDKAEAKS